jgi:hypothetical protein
MRSIILTLAASLTLLLMGGCTYNHYDGDRYHHGYHEERAARCYDDRPYYHHHYDRWD